MQWQLMLTAPNLAVESHARSHYGHGGYMPGTIMDMEQLLDTTATMP